MTRHTQSQATFRPELLPLGATGSFAPRHWLVGGDIVLCNVAFTTTGGQDFDGNPVDVEGVTLEVLRRLRPVRGRPTS